MSILDPQLDDTDLDLLSAYLDGQLATEERHVLEQRLQREPDLAAALDELRATVTLLRELEPLVPPRSFTIDPATVRAPRSWLSRWMQFGPVLATVLLVLTVTVVFLGRGLRFGTPAQTMAPQAAERNAYTMATVAPMLSTVALTGEDSSGTGAAAEQLAAAPTAAISAIGSPIPSAQALSRSTLDSAVATPEPSLSALPTPAPAAALPPQAPDSVGTEPALELSPEQQPLAIPQSPLDRTTAPESQNQGQASPPTVAVQPPGTPPRVLLPSPTLAFKDTGKATPPNLPVIIGLGLLVLLVAIWVFRRTR